MKRIRCIAHFALDAFLVIAGFGRGSAAAETFFAQAPGWSSSLDFTRNVAFGDLEGDGDLDLVCANRSSVTVYLNAGGAFVPEQNAVQPRSAESVALGDVDGDGDLDLVAGGHQGTAFYRNVSLAFMPANALLADSTLVVALGDVDNDGDLDLVRGGTSGTSLHLYSDGEFSAAAAWRGPPGTTNSLALGDLDNDGDIDVVRGGNRTELYDNVGGTFLASPHWTGDLADARSLVLGDVDNDGDLDLVCGYDTLPARLYLNTNGTFGTAPNWTGTADSHSGSVVLGDVDGDGDLDLVRGQPGAAGAALHLNFSGTFDNTPAWFVVRSSWNIALSDVDSDGDLDLTQVDGATAAVYSNVGGPFGQSIWRGANEGTRSVALGDVDGDGDLDLVRGNAGQLPGEYLPRPVTLYHNNEGLFSSTPAWTGPPEPTWSVALADVDGDGDLDLVRGNADRETTLYINRAGGFDSTAAWRGPEEPTWKVALGDVDNDGDLDLVRANFNMAATLYRNGGSSFDATPAWRGPFGSHRDAALGDVDGDGDVDLVVAVEESRLYLNVGGTFGSAPQWIGPNQSTTAVALGDIDGDGDLDLCRGNFNAGSTLHLNNGGVFADSTEWRAGGSERTRAVALGDMDGDGDLDLLQGNESGHSLYLNEGGTFGVATAWTGNDGFAYGLALGDVDGDGDLDFVGGGLESRLFLQESPWIRAGAAAAHLPNNPAHLRWVRCTRADSSHYLISFLAVDAEADPLWLACEYQLEGAADWQPMDFADGSSFHAGPFATSRAGVQQFLGWDATRVPFDDRDVVIRLRTISSPTRAGVIQFVPSYLTTVGRITPARPAIAVAPATLIYPVLTVGDSARATLAIENPGTRDLVIDRIESPHPEVQVDAQPPLVVRPGEVRAVDVLLAPTRAIGGDVGSIRIHSNDPTSTTLDIPVTADIRLLEVATNLVTATEKLPLGQAASFVITPAPQVRVERGFLYYRGRGNAFADSVALLRRGSGFIALVPGEDVTEAGLDYFVRVENSSVFATDPTDAPASTYFHAVEAPAGITVVPEADPVGGFPVGRPTRIVIIMPQGSVFQSGIVYHRPGGGAAYDSLDLSLTELAPGYSLPAAVIPATAIGPRGLEYRSHVQTLQRSLVDPPAGGSVRILRTNVGRLEEPREHPGGRFRLLSVPLGFTSSRTFDALLTDESEFGSYDPLRWRLFRYVAGAHVNEELRSGAAEFNVEPGRAFWLVSRQAHRIDTAPLDALSTLTGTAHPIVLSPGWNQIGNPFAFTVAWETVGRSDAIGSFIGFDPALGTIGDFVEPSPSILEPFAGYFVHNGAAVPETLWVPPVEAPPAKPVPQVLSLDSWFVRLQARTRQAQDGANAFGVDAAAADGHDALDGLEPPLVPGSWVQVGFARPESKAKLYRRDVRPAGGEGNVWEIEVRSEHDAEPVTLSLFADSRLPEELGVRLLDREQNTAVDLLPPGGELGSLEIVSFGPERPYRLALLAGTAAYIERQDETQAELPVRVVLEHGPNPFTKSARIRFGLPQAEHATLAVYDVRGQRVALLRSNQLMPAGYHVSLWNGTDAAGRPLASGVYFCRLETGGSSLTRRLVLLR